MYGRCSRSPDSLRQEKKDTEKLYIFHLNLKLFQLYKQFMWKQDDKRSIATKASHQNVEIVGKNGPQILTFSCSLQTGKMAEQNGGRQTANAGNVRSRDHLCRSRGKSARRLRWMVPVFRFFEYVNFERKEQKVNSTS